MSLLVKYSRGRMVFELQDRFKGNAEGEIRSDIVVHAIEISPIKVLAGS